MSKGFFSDPLSLHEMLIINAQGDVDGVDCMSELLGGPTGFSDIDFLTSLGLTGEMIGRLWNEACSRDPDTLKATIEAFKNGEYTATEIQERLSRWRILPFV